MSIDLITWTLDPVVQGLYKRVPETRSIFAFTMAENSGERRALLKAGFHERGPMPDPDYPVELPAAPCLLYIWSRAPDRSTSP